ncbi:UNVERIFIED_CONTAM: movement protein [Sesamum indicum]
MELSLEGSVKIGWDNTPEDTKASILAGDSKGAIADRLGRLIKIHFIGDGYFKRSRAEKTREYAQALFSLELRSICAIDEYIYWFRKYFFQSGVATEVAAPMFFTKICSPWREMLIQSYKENQASQGKEGSKVVTPTPGVQEEPFLEGDHDGPNPKPEHISLDKEQDQQGFHSKDLDEQRRDQLEEPPQKELSDGPIPELMKVSKTAIAGLAEQKDIYLPTTHRNVSTMATWYPFTNSKTSHQTKMDLQPSQNNYNEGDRLHTSESLSGFFSRITVSNKTMERIMRQDSNLSPYDGFRIGGIGKLITKEEILEELSKLREEIAITMKWIHIGTIEVVIKATFKEGIDSEIHLSIMDRRINNLRDGCLGTMIGNLYAGKLMFDIHPRIAYNLANQDFSRVLTLHQDFKRKDLMKEGNRPYSITYRIAYALSNTHHSDLFLRKEYIEIPRIFKEFAKVMTPDPIKIPRIGGVDIIIKDYPVLDKTLNSRTKFSSRMSFSEDMIIGYKGKEKQLKALTPQKIRVDNVKIRCPEGWKEIQVIFDITKKENYFPCDDLYHLQQPVVGKYEGMLEIAGHEILVAGRENGSMTLGLSFLEDHKPWGRKGNGMEFSLDGVFIRIE